MEALEISDSYAGSIDILITDVTMPRLSGLDLIRDLKPRRPGTRVLAISGGTDAFWIPAYLFCKSRLPRRLSFGKSMRLLQRELRQLFRRKRTCLDAQMECCHDVWPSQAPHTRCRLH